MAVAVYPHLDALLQERGLSILELKRIIEDRYGLAVDFNKLQSLAGSEPVDQTDLTLAGAVATVLGVSLNDLFSVEALPTETPFAPEVSLLSDAQSQRLSDLLTRQDEGTLDSKDARELEQLVDEYGRTVREYHLRSYAAKQGISFEEAEREVDRRFAAESTWLRDLDASPGGREALIEQVRQKRSSASR